MPLSDAEKESVRYHLGYLNTSPAASISLGFPAASQPMFLVESAMNLILPEAESRVRRFIGILDGIEAKLVEAQERMAAKVVGEITTNEKEPAMLEVEYHRWQGRLARQLGVYPNPFSPSSGLGGINVSVSKV